MGQMLGLIKGASDGRVEQLMAAEREDKGLILCRCYQLSKEGHLRCAKMAIMLDRGAMRWHKAWFYTSVKYLMMKKALEREK